MPKFKVLKEGVNEALIEKTHQKIQSFIQELFHEDEVITLDGTYSFTFGTVSVNVRVLPWHTEDVLVEVFSYVAEEIELTPSAMEELLRLNATTHFGAFGLTFDNSVIFSYSLAGANLDLNEFTAAVQTVATVADSYDELLKEFNV
ncbi:YbjN domain-containing protein [Thermonema rossianum]|uniref:YbjN domain-containing protein n=1 Tax=Thermonema rossianum TaxID=55505 RepID=UPI00068D2D39|nr:YbjN domain-containing protein [Thermonema rossianum]